MRNHTSDLLFVAEHGVTSSLGSELRGRSVFVLVLETLVDVYKYLWAPVIKLTNLSLLFLIHIPI